MTSAPDLPGISWESGVQHFAGCVDIYRKMLVRFIDLEGTVPLRFQVLLLSGNTEGARELTHTVISGAGMIGAERLSGLARQVHDRLRDHHDLEGLDEEFLDEFRRVLEGLIMATANNLLP